MLRYKHGSSWQENVTDRPTDGRTDRLIGKFLFLSFCIVENVRVHLCEEVPLSNETRDKDWMKLKKKKWGKKRGHERVKIHLNGLKNFKLIKSCSDSRLVCWPVNHNIGAIDVIFQTPKPKKICLFFRGSRRTKILSPNHEYFCRDSEIKNWEIKF